MKSAFALVLASLGIAIGALAAHVAIRGAEPPIPPPSATYEGEVVAGPTTTSPVGEPFAYGEIRVQDADDSEEIKGTIHWRGTFGSPNVVLHTSTGNRRIHLPPPGPRWRTLDQVAESRVVASLEGLPIVGSVDHLDRITPPYRVSALVLRAGDHLVVAKDPQTSVRVYVGTRADHVAFRAHREAGRWPLVAMLGLMAVISVFAARRVVSGTFFDDVPDDEDQPAT